MEVCGTRRAYMLLILPGTLGWLMIYLAQSYLVLSIARILNGITAGAVTIVGGIVIAEYTDPKHRGMFLNLKTSAICLGNTIVHILGKYLHWRTIAFLALIPHTIAIGITYTWPESPSWLASEKNYEKCEEAFIWLRGSERKAQWELKELIDAQKERLSENRRLNNINGKIKEVLNKFKRKDFLKPLFVSCTAFLLLESSTRHVFPTYALQIMSQITGSTTQPFYYTLCIDLMITASSIISSIIVRLMKRRTILFGTGILACVVVTLGCAYLFLVSRNVLTNDQPWIPVFLFALFFIIINLGCTPLPLVLQGEIFPLPHKAFGIAIAGTLKSLFIMAFLKITPYLLVTFKVYGAFMVFTSITAVSLIILYFILPETKDRTLQEIEDYFNHGKFNVGRSNVQASQKMISREES